MSILRALDLAKTYSRRRVVDGVSLEMNSGQIVGLLGPNGAGKTTTFRMICGMVTPDRGQVWLRDKDVTDWPMFVRARDGGMGYLPQQSSIFSKLSTEQNILAMLEMLGVRGKKKRERWRNHTAHTEAHSRSLAGIATITRLCDAGSDQEVA